MKHNLKNRPKKGIGGLHLTWKFIDEWFIGFEKELREICSNCTLNPKYPNVCRYCKDKITPLEILGET